MLVFVIIMKMIFTINATNLNMNTIVDISVAVVHHYQSKCVYILHSQSQQNMTNWQKLIELQSALSRKRIMTSLMSVKSLEVKTSCCPLFLISCNNFTENYFIHQISESAQLSNVRWLYFLDVKTSLEDYFSGTYIPLNCEFLVAQGDQKICLIEVFHLHKTGTLQTYNMANWTSTEGISWSTSSLYKRRDLQGSVIKGAILPYYPYISKCKNNKFSGYLMALWEELEHRMNFTTEYIVPKDDVFGFLENGTWNGVVGMVVHAQADVGISFFAYLPDRMEAVDFLPPIWNVKLMVHIKQPEMERSTFKHILSPFMPSLWFIVIISIVILTIMLSFTWYLQERHGILFFISESWLYVYGAFCQQGHDRFAPSLSCQIVFWVTYFLAVILFVAYSATFISFLAIRHYNLPFTNFEGLLEDGTFRLGLLSGSARISFFKNSVVESLRKVYQKVILPGMENLPKSDVEGLQWICEYNKYSYLISTTTLRGLARNIPCSIIGVPEAYYSITASMIITKFSIYKRFFSHHIQEMKYSGILDRIEKISWPPRYVEILEDEPPSVTFETVTIFFIILTLGIALAVVILIMELIVDVLKKKKIHLSASLFKN